MGTWPRVVAAACAALCGVARGWATFNVVAYGAVGDGVTSDTAAVRAALAAAAAAGGGTVLLPRGLTFLTGSVNVTSNVELRVEGTLKASATSAGGDYVLVPPLPWYGGGQDAQESGSPEWSAVVRSFGASNVSLTGGGTLDGNGGAAGGWWACFHSKLVPTPCSGYSRPQLVRLIHTVGVRIANLTFADSPSWTIHLANVTGAVVRGIRVTAPATEGNTDGIDIDCSSDIDVDGMYYAGGDDAIAVKSGMDFNGRTFGRPTSNVRVANLLVESGNGIAIGSEQSAGVHNVTFDGVTVSTARLGLPIKHGPYLKSQRGRGGRATNITFANMAVSGVGFGIGLTLSYHPGLPPTNATATPAYAGLTFVNFSSVGCAESFNFAGLNDSVITDVALRNVTTADRRVSGGCTFTEGTCDAATNHCPPCFNATGGGSR